MSPLFKIFRLLLYEVKLKSKSKSKIIEWIPLSGLIYFLVFIGYYFWMRGHDFSSFNSISAAGQFGDMFGAFNALFTGLAFVGLAITIWLQVEQFAEDKLDARNSQIETTFFSMMGNLQRIVETAYFNDESEGRVYSGREYFRFALNLLEGAYRSEIYKFQQVRFQSYEINVRRKYVFLQAVPMFDDEKRICVIKAYNEFYKINDYNLGHYFRYLYNVIKYIRGKYPSDTETQEKYVGLIQAQLSNDELGLLFYNAFSKFARNEKDEDIFRQWLDDYNFFQNIDGRCVFDDALTAFYPRSKFKYMTMQSKEA